MIESNKNRVAYVDPNNIASYNKSKDNFGDNITWLPEDLNISVDLQVVIPDRDNCGRIDYTNKILTVVPKQSYFQGKPYGKNEKGEEKDFFLSTTYTDVSYSEIKNNKEGNREVLGVESIDITMNPQFFPLVTIKFTDVRGASLIMPEELNYTEGLKNSSDDVYKTFFNALFHFPYPTFYLTIKGFYGTRETFLLSVEDFKTNFNAQNGNFDVTVKFIGNMYGIYNDLPFNYLIIAPYLQGKNNDVNEYWKSNAQTGGKYTFSDGREIPTFIKFLENYANISKTFTDALINGDEEICGSLKEVLTFRVKNIILKSILERKQQYDETIERVFKTAENGVQFFSNKNYYIVLKKTDKTISIDNTIPKDIKKLYEKYKEASNEKINNEECLSYIDDSETLSVAPQLLGVSSDSTTVYVINGSKQDDKVSIINGKKENCATVFINKNFAETIKDGYNYCIVYKKYSNKGEFFENIQAKIEENKEEIQKNYTENETGYREFTSKVLGFDPTLENVFRMIYAHLDCYMHFFYGTLSQVLTEERRTGFYLPPIQKIDTDIKNWCNCNDNLPPYTGFFKTDEKTKQRVRKYPYEHLMEGEQIAEVRFTENIYNCLLSLPQTYEKYKDVQEASPETRIKQQFIPLMPLDIFYNGGNPYEFLHNSNREEFMKDAFSAFIYRVATGMKCKSITYEDMELYNVGELNTHESSNYLYKDEVSNLLRVLDNREKRILYKELKKHFDESNLTPQEAIASIYSEGFENLTAFKNEKAQYTYSPVGGRTGKEIGYFKVTNSDDMILDVREMYNITTETKRLRSAVGTRVYQTYCNLSEEAIGEFPFGTWNYDRDSLFYGGLNRYEEGEITALRPSGLFRKDINTDNVINTGALQEGNPEREKYKVLYLQYGKRKRMKNLYFEKDILKGKSVKEKARMFLATLIGRNDEEFLSFIGGGTCLIRMPRFIRLFLGAEILNKGTEISIDKDGIFTNFVNSADMIGGKTIEEISEFCDTLVSEFEEWAEKEFPKLDALLEKYSEPWYGINHVYEYTTAVKVYNPKPSHAKELTDALLDFYLSTETVLQCNLRAEDPEVGFLYVLKFYEELRKQLDNDEEIKEEETAETTDFIREDNTEDLKSEIYYTHKALYDKWLSSFTEERFKLHTPEEDRQILYNKTHNIALPADTVISEFNSLLFMDTFYNNIGQTFYIDTKTLYKMILGQIDADGVQSNRSLLQFISDLAFEHKLLFIPLPIHNSFHDTQGIINIFTPHQIYDGNNNAGIREIGNTFMLMYTHEPSHSLDTASEAENGGDYEGDGFDIADSRGELTTEATELFQKGTVYDEDSEINGYTVPAFGVTFARQNQAYFKNISVNMDSPRQTDFSIYNMFELVGRERNGDVNSPVTRGQNMFSIYSNRSYNCEVEMLGCMNIMPTMYFQLNNIPLFKGAYMITKVEHHIKAGEMVTKFSGTRISKNSIPYTRNTIDIENLISRISGGANKEEEEKKITKILKTPQKEEKPKYEQDNKISKYFTLREFTYSSEAEKRGIDNTPKEEIILENIKEVARFLDELREFVGVPILITSGYRCPALNKAVGGVEDSAHLGGLAADIKPSYNSKMSMKDFKKKVNEFANTTTMPFDQIILERNNATGTEWVHVGVKNLSGKQRHNIFSLNV